MCMHVHACILNENTHVYCITFCTIEVYMNTRSPMYTLCTYMYLNMCILYMYAMYYTCTGQPVAWCITNYETSEVMAIFLESIRARSPSSTVTVLMTDDGMSVHVHVAIYRNAYQHYTLHYFFLLLLSLVSYAIHILST